MNDKALAVCLITTLTMIVLDTLLGILIAAKKREFSISKLPQFLATNVFPYIGGLLVLAGIGYAISDMAYLFYAAAGMVTVKFSKEALLDKVRVLFG
ncbi:MAG: hypothetical protein GXY34_15005 [Syntrophomonadaceae bacterium]|nr:hypothetical protein [Syntrophomonadaceae bacterium]